MTIPNKNFYKTFKRIEVNDKDEITDYIQPKEYHGDPIIREGVLEEVEVFVMQK